MRFTILLSAVLFFSFLAGCGTNVKESSVTAQDVQQIPAYLLTMPDAEKVSFSGYVNFDDFENPAGGSSMMYSGYSGAAFLASVLAHAAISQSIDEVRMNKFIEQSDLVLKEYREVLDAFLVPELEDAFFKSYQEAAMGIPLVQNVPDHSVALGELKVQPEFVMSEDGTVVLVETEFSILEQSAKRQEKLRRTRSRRQHSYGTKVVVVGDPIGVDPKQHWNARGGLALKEYSVDIFSDSIDLYADYLKDATSAKTGKQETVKYAIGDVLRIERGTVLERTCERVVFKSLRGWIKSAPIHPDYLDEVPGCDPVAAVPL